MTGRLLERSEQLRVLASAARAADQGRGSVVLVSGEAGVGKTPLVRAFRSSVPPGARVLTGYCDALSTPRALGPMKDIAASLGLEFRAAVQAGDRDLVMSALVGALAGGPTTVMVVEDLHWADEGTLDVLRHAAHRRDRAPARGLRRSRPTLARAPVHGAKPRLTAADLHQLTHVDGHDHVALVAESAEGRPVGVARFVRNADDVGSADVAVTVVDARQKHGVGTRLASALVDRARRLGVRRFTLVMRPDNEAALRLLHRVSGDLERLSLDREAAEYAINVTGPDLPGPGSDTLKGRSGWDRPPDPGPA